MRLKEMLDMKSGKNVARLPIGMMMAPASKIPEPTEYEYLRNILFEFMMGREPMVSTLHLAHFLKPH